MRKGVSRCAGRRRAAAPCATPPRRASLSAIPRVVGKVALVHLIELGVAAMDGPVAVDRGPGGDGRGNVGFPVAVAARVVWIFAAFAERGAPGVPDCAEQGEPDRAQ